MIYAYTDGGATNNNSSAEINHCGSGIVIIDLEAKKILRLSLYQEKGTNNVGELCAILEALKAVSYTRPKGTGLTIFTDSAYCITGCNNAPNWKEKGWRNSGGEVKNKELWEQFLALKENVDLTIVKVKGHSGNFYNEMADRLVEKARKTHFNFSEVIEIKEAIVPSIKKLIDEDINPFPAR